MEETIGTQELKRGYDSRGREVSFNQVTQGKETWYEIATFSRAGSCEGVYAGKNKFWMEALYRTTTTVK